MFASCGFLGSPLGALLGRPGGPLEPSWGHADVLERSRAVLDASWPLLGVSAEPPGPSWGARASGNVTRATVGRTRAAQSLEMLGPLPVIEQTQC